MGFKDFVSMVISSAAAIVIFIILTPIIAFLANIVFRIIFGGTMGNTSFEMETMLDWGLTALAVIISIVVGFFSAAFIYYNWRDKGFE